MPITQHGDFPEEKLSKGPNIMQRKSAHSSAKVPDNQGVTNPFGHETFHIRELSIRAVMERVP